MAASSSPPHCEKLLVFIVSYGNPGDVERCLGSLARSVWADFEIFLCENAGPAAYSALLSRLTGPDGSLDLVEGISGTLDRPGGRLEIVTRCRLRDRTNAVRLAAAVDNLGYAGGVNAWLERLLECSEWGAALVLNPDTEVAETCLSELMAKAAEGYGMVGASLVFDSAPERIVSFGLHWSRWTGRTIAVGRDSAAGTVPSDEVIGGLDAISGSCLLVTRAFVQDVGLMAEDYFLYMEDLDWGLRRGSHRIGFARRAVVRHVGGAAIGSTTEARAFSPLAVYLDCRNRVLFFSPLGRVAMAAAFCRGPLVRCQVCAPRLL